MRNDGNCQKCGKYAGDCECPDGVASLARASGSAACPELTKRQISNALAWLNESARLKALTAEQLIAETLATEAADYLVVTELMNRVLPGWAEAPDGTYDEQQNTSIGHRAND